MKKLGGLLLQVFQRRTIVYLLYRYVYNFMHLYAAMPELLRSAKLTVEKGQSQGRDESYVKQLSDYIIPALLEALHKVRGKASQLF
jgi:importin-5